MALSDAVSLDRLSRIVGYKLTGGDFSETTPNLPQRIALIGQANTANQSLIPSEPLLISSAKVAGDVFGYGSPIHQAARMLKPVYSDGVGAIPVYAYPQAKASAGAALVMTVTVAGTATANATHTVVIAGRSSIDGEGYLFDVLKDDTAAVIAGKISDAINGVVASPFTAVATGANIALTSKYEDNCANALTVEMDNGDNGVGVTYAVAQTTAAAGTVTSVPASLALFGENWNTIVINTYDVSQTSILDALEAFNGIPDAESPTGRYTGIVMKPFIALTGTNDDTVADIISNITGGRKEEVTNAICLATGSDVTPGEIATAYAVLLATVSRSTPHLDIAGRYLTDVPVSNPSNILNTQDYDYRDQLVKAGCSTVLVKNNQYEVQDFVTTYRPSGVAVPQYRYVRSLVLDFNVRFGYYLLEQANVVDHVIAKDDDVVSASKVVKPKQWKGIIDKYADDLSKRALIVDAPFMQDSVTVELSAVNPDRLETFFRYKRSGFMRVASTTAEAGFNFGSN